MNPQEQTEDCRASAPPAEAKPPLTAKEASYHRVQAGRAALMEAQAQGAPAAAVDALMDTGPVTIAGIELKPLTLATTWALEAVGSVYAKGADPKAPAPVGPKDVALATLCFSEPVPTYKLARSGHREALEDRAIEIAAQISFADMQAINAWMNGQFALVKQLSGGDEDDDDAATSDAPTEKKTVVTPPRPAAAAVTG